MLNFGEFGSMRFLYLILFGFMSSNCLAQLVPNQWWLGGTAVVRFNQLTGLLLSPEIGYVFSPKWSAGTQISLNENGIMHGELFARRQHMFRENYFVYGQAVVYAEQNAGGIAADAGMLFRFHPRWMIGLQSNIFTAGLSNTQSTDSWFAQFRLNLVNPRIGLLFRL